MCVLSKPGVQLTVGRFQAAQVGTPVNAWLLCKVTSRMLQPPVEMVRRRAMEEDEERRILQLPTFCALECEVHLSIGPCSSYVRGQDGDVVINMRGLQVQGVR